MRVGTRAVVGATAAGALPLLLALIMTGCADRAGVEPSVTITSDGVERVAWPALPERALDVERVAEWNLWDPSGDYLFNEVTAVAGGAGRFFLLDGGNQQVVALGEEGDVEMVLSRQGSGPGELRAPTWLDVRDGVVWVADVANRRFALFDAVDGSLRYERRWPGSARIVNPFRVSDNEDVLHGGSWPLTVAELEYTDPIFYLARFALGPRAVATSEQGVADTLLTIPAPPYQAVPMTDSEGRTRLPYFGFPALSPDLRWDARGATVVTASSNAYRIEIRGLDGGLQRDLTLATAPIPVTGALREWYWEEVFPRQFYSQEPYEPSAGSRDRFPFAPELPAISGLALDQGGRIWVGANLPEPGRGRLDLWTLEGEFLGSIPDMPLPMAFLENGTFLVRSSDPRGLDRFATWRLRR